RIQSCHKIVAANQLHRWDFRGKAYRLWTEYSRCYEVADVCSFRQDHAGEFSNGPFLDVGLGPALKLALDDRPIATPLHDDIDAPVGPRPSNNVGLPTFFGEPTSHEPFEFPPRKLSQIGARSAHLQESPPMELLDFLHEDQNRCHVTRDEGDHADRQPPWHQPVREHKLTHRLDSEKNHRREGQARRPVATCNEPPDALDDLSDQRHILVTGWRAQDCK